ncbi:hypothetical protein VQ7734_04764 [Vibrio quintilis]|uniref:Uncharacterized protein n=1 Tax=Vibrio quintilis TaxID=1117707 RepID=A0A1M7Z1Z3_9VIBR|nr:hypothetical protein VQ7734_04764 [Vibrio quintilis]
MKNKQGPPVQCGPCLFLFPELFFLPDLFLCTDLRECTSVIGVFMKGASRPVAGEIQ